MRLLVTGGAGYIGSVVTRQLLEAGHDVTVLDSLATGHRDAVPTEAQFVHGDIADPLVTSEALSGVLTESGPVEGVLHFAAFSLVGESGTDPGKYYRNNVAGTLGLLEAMRDAGGGAPLVFSSTAATYGEPEVVPIAETAVTKPTNAYGATKLAVDAMISFFAAAYGMRATSLRYFNVAGAYGGAGERHTTETHLVPLVLQAAAGVRPSVSIYGTDYPTPDGTAIRDYIHVEDLGRAHLLALDGLLAETSGREGRHTIFNLGCGDGFSVREVIETARAVTGREIPAVEVERRAGDPSRLVASSELITERLGWKPEHDLARMVADAWEFAQSRA